ncbi:MAG: hydantoinase/oxoprolinase family protein [Bryobacteraceae bacterium]
MMRIAIDTGGTFTDCVYLAKNQLTVLKIASTPADPAKAVVAAINSIAGDGPVQILHGTTVGTNALLERKGARTAFVTTAGFEDTIAIGRQTRSRLYDWFLVKEPPLVPEDLRFGIAERVASDGSILAPVEPEDLDRLRQAIRDARAESVAVSLLFSFANPSNEKAVTESLRQLGIPVSASHEILPEFREYERASTIVINAYLCPKVQQYLGKLNEHLETKSSQLFVMQSSGGVAPAAIVAHEPVRTILSGPAGGVVGALHVAQCAGFSRILTFDMGGTSTDVALVQNETGSHITTCAKPFGGVLRSSTKESQVLGMPVAVPMLDIHTVGAGGGSLAGFDHGGALRVGPQSAGADPGPVCYGYGETPTVTDANLLLGRVDAEYFLGGKMRLDVERARRYCEVAKGALRDGETFAEGVVRLADSHMEGALRKISVERGLDPREFVLVSFGGAGPMHACALARALKIPRVLVPQIPGALSAYGILVSDIVRDYSRTVMLPSHDQPALLRQFEALEKLAAQDLQANPSNAIVTRSADLRYTGQGYELTVDWSDDFVNQFHLQHERRYGYADPERPVEVVNARVHIVTMVQPPPQERHASRAGDAANAVIKAKPIYVDGAWSEALVYDRSQFHPGDCFRGPAVVVEYSATTFVPPRCQALVDEYSNLLIEVMP